MPRRRDKPEPQSVHEEFERLTVQRLRPLARLLTSDAPKRKPDLVNLLARSMTSPRKVRTLYEQLDSLAQTAIQEATFDPKGLLQHDKFVARYGRMPSFDEGPPEERIDYREEPPTPLALFFPANGWLPTDLRKLLLDFVPKPADFTLPTLAEPPGTVRQTWIVWKHNRPVEEEADVPLRIRATAREAEHDLRAALRLVEAGRVRISEKKRQPTTTSQKAIRELLLGGDFYTDEDQDDSDDDPDVDLTIKAFAWPMLLQAAELVQKSGDNLKLTPAGRKALAGSASTAIRAIFRKWRSSTLFDEFSRVQAIKGQGKGVLSALAGRRKAVLDGLASCPSGVWFSVNDFFRFLRATDRDFDLTHRPYDLYIAERDYGSLSYCNEGLWEQLQGRYILAVLFEYAATLGLIDVAYLPPQEARDDFRDRWGADDLSYLSRYDGLSYLQINALGTWCLGLVDHYETPPPLTIDVVQVLPNLDIVAKNRSLAAADRLVLDRYAERQSEGVWKMTPAKLQSVLEEGGELDQLEEFLKTHTTAALPQTVEVFLQDQRQRAGRLRDLGMVRLIECADAALAQSLVHESQLRNKCRLAGDRWLVFQIEDEAAVRKGLRRLGQVLPPPS